MIVVDMSALTAILLDGPEATACMNAPSTADTLSIWAGTIAEALIVADRRGCGQEMRRLINGLAPMFRPSRQPRRAQSRMLTFVGARALARQA